MAISLPQGFNIGSNEPIDQRLLLTKEEMKAVIKGGMPQKYFCICKDDGKLYIYDSESELDPEVGHFKLALQDELEEKQDKLTAGDNITIKNNVISSTGAGKTYKAGENIQISSDLTISATDTIYDDSEIRGTIEDINSNISDIEDDVAELYGNVSDIQGNVTELQSNVGELQSTVSELSTKTTQIETNLTTVSEKVTTLESDVSEVKSDVSEIKSDVSTAKSDITELKSDVSSAKSDIETLETNVTSLQTNVTSLQTNVTSLQEEVEHIEETAQPKLIAGANITISEDNVISAIGGGGSSVLTQELTVGYDVGGLKAGTVYSVGTSIESILRDMLAGEGPVGDGKIYTMVGSVVPTSVSGMTPVSIDKDALLTSGYTWKNVALNNEYAFLAVDKKLGITVYEITQNGFGLGFETVDLGNQWLYYPDTKGTDTGIRFVYKFEE